MADYTQNEDYSVKDGLAADDPEKLILGSDIDSELSEIQTAIDSKYDSSDIATQAQAEAGVSNATLMTPLRVAQFLGIGGAGGGTAGAIEDILALNDPGDDRIMYWDESANVVTFLDVGTHLEITAGSVLNVVETGIDHDALTNFVANEHIDHTAVTLTAGEGLTGGGNIAADRSFALDINGLTLEGTIDNANDQVVFYDASATAHRRVQIDALIGDDLGDGRFVRETSNQATSAGVTADIIFNGATENNLTRGTYSTSTGEYTAGSEGARLFVNAQITIETLDPASDAFIQILANGVVVARDVRVNPGGVGPVGAVLQCAVVVTLGASQVLKVQVNTDNAEAITSSAGHTQLSIQELG